jgi:hypothetical protein
MGVAAGTVKIFVEHRELSLARYSPRFSRRS